MIKDNENTKKSVLIVDDIDSIRGALCEYLEPEFYVFSASDGFEAIEVLAQSKIDFILSDIRMPGMGGLQLFRFVQDKKEYKNIVLALMTAYNTDEYIQFARENKIWNIIPKSTHLELHYVLAMVKKLLTGSIFGVQKYFEGIRDEYISLADLHRIHRHKYKSKLNNRFFHIKVGSTDQNSIVCDMIGDILCENGSPSICRTILEELSANAIIHAPGTRKKIKQQVLEGGSQTSDISIDSNHFDENDELEIGFGLLNNKMVLSVSDFHGAFDKESALECLERQTKVDPASGLPIGLIDYHGRGLFISREQLDQLVFNIKPGEKTEIIGILDIDSPVRTRAISIYQV